jgi:hypothetical protein
VEEHLRTTTSRHDDARAQRATAFITALGWLTLALSAAVGLGALGEAAAAQDSSRVPNYAPLAATAPVLWRRALWHGGLAAVGLGAAWGLLRRRWWARNLTAALIVLATAALVPELFGEGAAVDVPAGLSLMGFASVCVLHLNLLRRLREAEVRAQFNRPTVG